MKPLTANDLVVGGKYVPHSKSIGCLSLEEIKRKMSKIGYNYLIYKGERYSGNFHFAMGVSEFIFLPSDVTPYHEPNQTIMNTEELKDNKIMLLEEDLWCVHRYLDDLKIPRVDKDEKEYSIVGRIKRLEERYLKQMSEIETQNLSNNYTEQPFNLETALKHPEWVRTRDGREIDFIKDYPETRGFFPIVSITKCGSFYLVNKNGKVGQLESDFDLILRVPYREVWVNIYPNGNCVWYDTKEEANEYNSNSTTIVACVPVKIPAI
jgi:hypothetical protein